jgi:hypothetical protein
MVLSPTIIMAVIRTLKTEPAFQLLPHADHAVAAR